MFGASLVAGSEAILATHMVLRSARDGAIGGRHHIAVAAGDCPRRSADLVARTPTDSSVATGGSVGPATGDRCRVAAGCVAPPSANRGMVAARRIAYTTADGGSVAVGAVARAAADGCVEGRGGIGFSATDRGEGLLVRIAIVGTGHVATATADGAIFVVHPVVGRGWVSGILGPAARDGAVGCHYIVVPSSAHRGIGPRCLVFLSPRDCSIGVADYVAGAPAHGSKGGIGLVKAATRNGGLSSGGCVVPSPADGGIGRAGGVGQSTANYGVGIARAIAFTTADRGCIAAGDVASPPANGSKVGGHLVDGHIPAAAADGGPINARRSAVATVATEDIGARLIGLEAQSPRAVHTEFQWLIVARAQEVCPGRRVAVAGQGPARGTCAHVVLTAGPDGSIPLCDLADVAAEAGQGIVVDVIAKPIGHTGETSP